MAENNIDLNLDNFCSPLKDPFYHTWTVNTHISRVWTTQYLYYSTAIRCFNCTSTCYQILSLFDHLTVWRCGLLNATHLIVFKTEQNSFQDRPLSHLKNSFLLFKSKPRPIRLVPVHTALAASATLLFVYQRKLQTYKKKYISLALIIFLLYVNKWENVVVSKCRANQMLKGLKLQYTSRPSMLTVYKSICVVYNVWLFICSCVVVLPRHVNNNV